MRPLHHTNPKERTGSRTQTFLLSEEVSLYSDHLKKLSGKFMESNARRHALGLYRCFLAASPTCARFWNRTEVSRHSSRLKIIQL